MNYVLCDAGADLDDDRRLISNAGGPSDMPGSR